MHGIRNLFSIKLDTIKQLSAYLLILNLVSIIINVGVYFKEKNKITQQ